MKGLLTGSFNPPTIGHLDLIKRAQLLFTPLIIGVGENLSKRSIEGFSQKECKNLLEKCLKGQKNIKIILLQGLVTDLVKKEKIDCLIRGVRTPSDFAYESQMAYANRKLGNIETLFMMSSEEKTFISSSLLREIAYHGGSLKDFIPEEIEYIVKEKIKNNFK
jgi:pantetheine-phosphate adenylyltransferase